MKKIISLFQRNYETDHLVRDEIVPGAEWVIAGEGIATRKYDGTCCLIRNGLLYKRYDAKRGKTPPPGFEPAQEPDPVTGHWPGWIAVGDEPDSRWHREAFAQLRLDNRETGIQDGTYELIGPKVNANPERFSMHVLIPHDPRYSRLTAPPARTFETIQDWFTGADIEGIVWHHPDGRMVKIKKKDFGLKR